MSGLDWRSLGIRTKLIALFVLIKVIPLLLLAWFAWDSSSQLAAYVRKSISDMSHMMNDTVSLVSTGVTDDAIRALDVRSREAIERLTTDTARNVATFLYDRDDDVRLAASLEPDSALYATFLRGRTRVITDHLDWRPTADGTRWEPASPRLVMPEAVGSSVKDNEKDFHYRPPEELAISTQKPLFLEMTFVGLDGKEKIKHTTDPRLPTDLRDVSDRRNTFAKAETYFQDLKALEPGQVYVSDVIGAYVPTRLIGAYTPAEAQKRNIAFEPEKSGYAGMENPVGKRYFGLVRWATPVQRGGKIIGWVTLALDHRHLAELVDHIVPTDDRYSPITDAGSGNYAFIWDYLGRSVVHPRHYFMTGYDPETGEPAVPWLEDVLYDDWKASGKSVSEFLKTAPTFHDQGLHRKPAKQLVAAGTVGLDCRYLNFAPQCAGWMDLTSKGGSGSFLIKWSGLWKLTTAATIPYYTGHYGKSQRGFGFVTVGANVDDFHRAATEAKERIDKVVQAREAELTETQNTVLARITGQVAAMTDKLSISTLLMTALVIAIAVWMASVLTRRITTLTAGIQRFEQGDLKFRLPVISQDEMGGLALSLNHMADAVEESVLRLEEAKSKAEEVSRAKSEFLATMSHELRTPLNGILGFADMLRDDAESEETRQSAQVIFDSGSHLVELVNSILDLAKIEAGMLTLFPEDVALRDLVDGVVQTHTAIAQAKGVQLSSEWSDDVPQTIRCDTTRLRQVLHNLLGNAVKFTDHGHVSIGLSMDGELIRIQVQDTGIGIAPENVQRLFQNFYQAETFATRTRGGTGLGLAMSKNLVEAMGGQIGVQSTIGQGSTFWFTLPVVQP